ncbi:MAG: hypothetical protein WDO17_03680 [Alphaproteobacteria bacterium]
MTRTARSNTCVLLAVASALLMPAVAYAEDINGLWATDGSKCSQIFTKAGATYAFAQNSDIYGSGFIIDGRKVVTQMAKCDIKTSKQDGPVTHLILACATDVMLSSVQASFKMAGNDRMVRIFSGFSDMEIPYERCALK